MSNAINGSRLLLTLLTSQDPQSAGPDVEDAVLVIEDIAHERIIAIIPDGQPDDFIVTGWSLTRGKWIAYHQNDLAGCLMYLKEIGVA